MTNETTALTWFTTFLDTRECELHLRCNNHNHLHPVISSRRLVHYFLPSCRSQLIIRYYVICFRYNGYLPQGDKGRQRSKFVLLGREKPNGIKRSRHYIVDQPQNSQAILDASLHSISYTLSRNQAVIVEYVPDEDTDMFQVRCHAPLFSCKD